MLGLLLVGTTLAAPQKCRIRGGYTAPSLSSKDHESCPADTAVSCQLGTQDSCCYEGTNGIFLSTQFWDFYPETGPSDAFTLHGLWNDKCAGGYEQYCNPSWEIEDARKVLEDLGKTDLLDQMDKYWKNDPNSGADQDLWLHEFNKHGTCMATLNPDCYSDGAAKYEYVGDFYDSAFALYQSLPTYKWLTSAGIYPDANRTHNVADFGNTLLRFFEGREVFLGCDKNNNLNEVWYFYSLKGSVASGQFTPIDSISKNSCKDGFKWLPKGTFGGDTTTVSNGTFTIVGQDGCLVSNGKWANTDQCAKYTVTSTIGGVALKTSDGPCGIVDGAITCGSNVKSSDFTVSKNVLSYSGSDTFGASAVPSGDDQQSLQTSGGSVQVKI